MLASDSAPTDAAVAVGPSAVAQVFQERVAPCGAEALRWFQSLVDEKLADVRALEDAPEGIFPELFHRVLQGVPSSRAHRSRIVDATVREEVQTLLRAARNGYLGPAQLSDAADRVVGAPREVRLDVASELLHGAAPDRMALLSRWVWNPSRGSGALREFGGPPPESYLGTQARLGEIRLELNTLGFPCATFSGVDVVLALAYAARVRSAAEDGLRSGGLEALLPGPFPIATMILGVRRRASHADR